MHASHELMRIHRCREITGKCMFSTGLLQWIWSWSAQNGREWQNKCYFPWVNRTVIDSKTPENAFHRICSNSHWEEILENACFRLENSCEYFVNRAKNGSEQNKTWHFLCVIRTANTGNHYVFLYLHALIFQENACFQPLTPVNTLLYTGKMPMNKRKTSCLQCVNRAVNAGK